MAKAKPNPEHEQQSAAKSTEIQAAPNTAVSAGAIDYGADAGAGMENTSVDSFAIPFLAVLQSNSPQCVEGESKYNPDARPGMLLNTVTGKLYDGKTGVTVVPAAYRRVFLKFGPRSGEGSGFKGEFLADDVAKLRAEKKIVEFENRLYEPLADGGINPKRCNQYRDSRLHYCVLVDEGEYHTVLLSLASTQIKKSKQLMSALTSVRVKLSDGRKVQPPTFANLVKITTVPESNDDGNWFGVAMSIVGRVEAEELYATARNFHDSVIKGTVSANYESASDAAAHGESAAQDGF